MVVVLAERPDDERFEELSAAILEHPPRREFLCPSIRPDSWVPSWTIKGSAQMHDLTRKATAVIELCQGLRRGIK